MSIVRLIGIDERTLHVSDIDVADGTPLLDIKPWVPDFDVRRDARAGGLENRQGHPRSRKSDRRFVENGTKDPS